MKARRGLRFVLEKMAKENQCEDLNTPFTVTDSTINITHVTSLSSLLKWKTET
jgi:hypothetical protein